MRRKLWPTAEEDNVSRIAAAIEALPEPVRLGLAKFAASIAAGSPEGLWRMSGHRSSSTPCATTSLMLAVSPE